MKILTALMITLASLSTVHAVEPVDATGQGAMEPSPKEITVAFANTVSRETGTGECEAVCTLPMSGGEGELPWME